MMLAVALVVIASVAAAGWLVHIVCLVCKSAVFDATTIGSAILLGVVFAAAEATRLIEEIHQLEEWRTEVQGISLDVSLACEDYRSRAGHDPIDAREAGVAFERQGQHLQVVVRGSTAWSGENLYSYRGLGVSVEGRSGYDYAAELPCDPKSLCILATAVSPQGLDAWRIGCSRIPIAIRSAQTRWRELIERSCIASAALVVGALIDRGIRSTRAQHAQVTRRLELKSQAKRRSTRQRRR